MSGSSPAGQSTSTKTVNPTGNIADYNSQGLRAGGSLYNAGPVYTGLNGDQTSGLNEVARIANSGNQTANNFFDFANGFTNGQYMDSNIANPGLKSLAGNSMNTQEFQNNLKTLGTGAMSNPANPYLSRFAGSGATGTAQDMLMKSARGDFLSPETNPWLKGTFDQGMQGVQGAVTNAMAASGRYGSGAMAGAIGSGATNLANDIYGGNYQQERTRQQQAQDLIGQLQSSDRGQQQQAAEALGNLFNTGTQLGISANTNAGQLAAGDRQAVGSALSQLSSNYNSGLNATTEMARLSPVLGEARYNDMSHLLAAGKSFQDDSNAWAAEPWKRLQDYMGISQGLNPGSQTTESNPYFSNSFGEGLTGAAGTAALLSKIFGGSGANGTGPSLASSLGSAGMSAYSKLAGLFGGGGAPLSSTGTGLDLSGVGAGSGWAPNYFDPSVYGTGGSAATGSGSDFWFNTPQ
jgi:hypothetical protein